MNKEPFDSDPFIGCPFDDSEMELVDELGRFRVGGVVRFSHLRRSETGTILAIGKNAKYGDGIIFTALVIRVGQNVFLKADNEIEGNLS